MATEAKEGNNGEQAGNAREVCPMVVALRRTNLNFTRKPGI